MSVQCGGRCNLVEILFSGAVKNIFCFDIVIFVSEYFAEIHLSSSSEAVNLFRERCLQIVKVNQNLPTVKKRTLNEMVSIVFYAFNNKIRD